MAELTSVEGSRQRTGGFFAISLRDAADFALGFVEKPLWWSTPRRSFRLAEHEIRLAPRPIPNCPQGVEDR
jgi:hypothetical protein